MWDAETLFSDEQALAAADSDNIVDAGAADIGKGHPVYLAVNVGAGASGDLAVTLKTSDADDMTGAVDVAEYTVPTAGVEKGGVVLSAPLPTGCKRYLRLAYAGATGGVVTAGLVLGAETSQM